MAWLQAWLAFCGELSASCDETEKGVVDSQDTNRKSNSSYRVLSNNRLNCTVSHAHRFSYGYQYVLVGELGGFESVRPAVVHHQRHCLVSRH